MRNATTITLLTAQLFKSYNSINENDVSQYVSSQVYIDNRDITLYITRTYTIINASARLRSHI